MVVKVSKKMAKQLQKEFKEYKIEYQEMTEQVYSYCVDINSFNHDNDYDFITNKFKVLKVIYPSSFYALPKYLTTNDLLRLFLKSNKTYKSFIAKVKNEIEC